jgi:hypothetical protein
MRLVNCAHIDFGIVNGLVATLAAKGGTACFEALLAGVRSGHMTITSSMWVLLMKTGFVRSLLPQHDIMSPCFGARR